MGGDACQDRQSLPASPQLSADVSEPSPNRSHPSSVVWGGLLCSLIVAQMTDQVGFSLVPRGPGVGVTLKSSWPEVMGWAFGFLRPVVTG